MIELHRQRVFEKIPPPWLLEQKTIRNQRPAHQWPGIRNQTCVEARHQPAKEYLQEDQAEQNRTDEAKGLRRRLPPVPEAGRDPQHIGKNGAGKRQMDRQPILTDIRARSQAARHHPPADGPLQPSENEDAREPRREAAANPACRPEPDQRDEESDADEATEKAMRPFPPEDRLEIRQAHALVDQLVFGNLLIFGEFLLPGRLVQWRNHAVDRLPFGDRKPGIGQAGRAADQNHQHDQQGNPVQPPTHRRQAARWWLFSDIRRGGDTCHACALEAFVIGLAPTRQPATRGRGNFRD